MACLIPPDISCFTDAVYPPNCVAYGPGLYLAQAGVQNSVQVRLSDRYSNLYTTGNQVTANLLSMVLTGPTEVSSLSTTYNGSGIYSLPYLTQVATAVSGAKYSLNISYNTVQIGGSYTNILQVLPGKFLDLK
jgi:hypothetical protein